jgi:hypothetical protein
MKSSVKNFSVSPYCKVTILFALRPARDLRCSSASYGLQSLRYLAFFWPQRSGIIIKFTKIL